MSWLGALNKILLQWFFIRLFVTTAEGTPSYYGILYWIVPTTGWSTPYKSVGDVKYYYLN